MVNHPSLLISNNTASVIFLFDTILCFFSFRLEKREPPDALPVEDCHLSARVRQPDAGDEPEGVVHGGQERLSRPRVVADQDVLAHVTGKLPHHASGLEHGQQMLL